MLRKPSIPALLALLVLAGCGGARDAVEPALEARRAAIGPQDPLYDRVEGTAVENRCATDDQCFVGGCSGEVCSAEATVTTTCELVKWPPAAASCGCVEGSCIWYTAP